MGVRITLTTPAGCYLAARAWLDEGQQLDCEAPWGAWEAAFVQRWELVPEDGGREARRFLHEKELWNQMLTFPVAARAWHANHFRVRPEEMDRWKRMEKDFDLVPREQVEGDLDEEDWRKLEQYNERFDPRHPSRRGRRFIH